MQTKELLKTVKKIEISARKHVDSLLQGNYHSVFKGQGMEFSDVREYVPGDDVRSIDWNITARTNVPHIKQFIEERNLNIYILFDVSASETFGNEQEKRLAGAEIAATILFSAIRNADHVGLALFSEDVEEFIPSRSGKKHALALLSTLISYEAKQKQTNIKQALRKLGQIVRKRSIIFIISDFMADDFEKELGMLHKKHDVICANLRDRNEEEIPDIGYTYLQDAETGEKILVNTSDQSFREQYEHLVKKQKKEFKKSLQKYGIDHIDFYVNEEYIVPLRKFFSLRATRA